MKMLMVIIPRDEAERVLQALVAANHTATFMETRGGMLRQAQMTLFIAVQDEDLEKVTHIIQGPSPSQPVLGSVEGGGPLAPMPVKPRPGGAVIFVWNVERSETH